MRLTFEHFDGHERYVDIIAQDTGKRVGHIQSHGSGFDRYGGMDIWLFGGNTERPSSLTRGIVVTQP
jgi:hypothetical protein